MAQIWPKVQDDILHTIYVYLPPLWRNSLQSYRIRWNNTK